MTINITIDAAPGLLNAIGLLAGVLAGLQGNKAQSIPQPTIEPVTAMEPPEMKPAALEPESTAATPADEQPPRQGQPESQPGDKPALAVIIKQEDIRAVAMTKDKAKVKALLEKWGYKSISAIDETDRSEFLAELRGL